MNNTKKRKMKEKYLRRRLIDIREFGEEERRRPGLLIYRKNIDAGREPLFFFSIEVNALLVSKQRFGKYFFKLICSKNILKYFNLLKDNICIPNLITVI